MSGSQLEDAALGKERYYGVMLARVVDVADPLSRHRVRLAIPGIVERSAWAFPLREGTGAGHGGGPNYAVGDVVAVSFMGGDPQSAIFVHGGYHGTDPEAPVDAVRGLSPTEAPLVHGLYEVGGYAVSIDERAGKRQLVVQDRLLGDMIQMDGEGGAITIRATSALKIVCDGAIEVEGASLKLNGRVVLPESRPV